MGLGLAGVPLGRALARCDLSPDRGLFARCPGPIAVVSIGRTFHSLALALGRRSLAMVCERLPLVSGRLAMVGDVVAFVSGPFALVGEPLAPGHGRLAVCELALALIALGCTPVELVIFHVSHGRSSQGLAARARAPLLWPARAL